MRTCLTLIKLERVFYFLLFFLEFLISVHNILLRTSETGITHFALTIIPIQCAVCTVLVRMISITIPHMKTANRARSQISSLFSRISTVLLPIYKSCSRIVAYELKTDHRITDNRVMRLVRYHLFLFWIKYRFRFCSVDTDISICETANASILQHRTNTAHSISYT